MCGKKMYRAVPGRPSRGTPHVLSSGCGNTQSAQFANHGRDPRNVDDVTHFRWTKGPGDRNRRTNRENCIDQPLEAVPSCILSDRLRVRHYNSISGRGPLVLVFYVQGIFQTVKRFIMPLRYTLRSLFRAVLESEAVSEGRPREVTVFK